MPSLIKDILRYREIMEKTGAAKATVTKYRKEALEEADRPVLCKCGKPVGHKEWCSEREKKSPKRQDYLKKTGEKRKSTKKKFSLGWTLKPSRYMGNLLNKSASQINSVIGIFKKLYTRTWNNSKEFLKNQKGKLVAIKKNPENKQRPFKEIAEEEYDRLENEIEELESTIKKNTFELQKLRSSLYGIEEYLRFEDENSKRTVQEAYDEFLDIEIECLRCD